ncbi:MAG TPA: penicillin-binding transpeptidase domain-containing protein [Anaerolineales bacterium]|nr:penicillin-binding transpeptidase domain-containing protein [Anaerolineales bacterium]
MRIARWLELSVLVIVLGACSRSSGNTPGPAGTGTAAMTGTPPEVNITHAPDAGPVMKAYLEALQKNDFASMYGVLSSSSQDVLKQDDFVKKYTDALDSLSAAKLDYQILSETKNPNAAQVGFRIVYHTALFGDIARDMNAHFNMEQGQWRLQWDDGLILPELAGGNLLKTDYQIPSRGDIYDQNGLPMVTQKDAYALGITPGQLGGKSEGVLVAELAMLCHKTVDSIKNAYANAAPDWYVAICDSAADETQGILDLNASGLTVTPYSSRFYLDQGIAPQVVGYASLIHKEDIEEYRRNGYRGDEKVGQTGIEKSMEQYLAGKHGGTLYVVDPNGQIVSKLGSTDPQPADSVYLTIDKNLQEEVQKTLMSFTGAAVVMERDTGRVLAMASSPGYDQNLFDPNNFNSGYLLGDLMNDQNQPLVNRAAQGQYPLGSAFKPITMAAALESGLYLPQTTYDCQYDFTELQSLGGPVLHDWTWEHCQDRIASGKECNTSDSQPSGLLTLQEGLMRSCDPYFWHIGLDLYNNNRAGDIASMAKAFGLGSATGIDAVAEATGNIPVPTEPIDATNEAIGQGDVQVTPLQVARFVAAIGNGGTLYRPQLIEKIQPVNGDPVKSFKPEAAGTLPLRPDNLKAIQESMQMVVKDPRGTAYYRMLGLDLPFAGKTGTAQTGPGLKPDAWFIGYTDDAANSGKPDIAIAVILENQGEGSDWAAPVFRGIVQSYYYGSIQTVPWFGPFDNPYTPTPFGGVPTKTPRPRGRQPTPTP